MNNICIHHWIIEIPNGPTSDGICKYCNETKVFFNTFSESIWIQNRSATVRTMTPDERDLELVG